MEIQNKDLHRVVATAIIHKGGKYLIAQRSPNLKSFPGRWGVPGGGLEVTDYINEPKTTSHSWYFAIENSLRREIKEETGLEVGKLKYLLDLVFIRPDNIPVICLSYYCDWKAGEVELNEENINYAWTTFEEAKKYDLVEGMLEEIGMVDEIFKGENLEKVEFNYKNLK